MVTPQFLENLSPIISRVFVSAPVVYAVTARSRTEAACSLAHRQIGESVEHSEFDEASGAKRVHEPEREWSVLHPGGPGHLRHRLTAGCRDEVAQYTDYLLIRVRV